jgi:hypothetical protein
LEGKLSSFIFPTLKLLCDNEDNVNGCSFREYEREEYLMSKKRKLTE